MKHIGLLLTPFEKELILEALSALIQNSAVAALLDPCADRTADVLAFLDAHPLMHPQGQA